MPEPDTTRIAIVGAGIGGLSAALSLRRLPNVDVQVFEQTHVLREVGASIALGPNGLRGLEEMGALNAISDEIAFRSDHGYPMVHKHWKTGKVLVKDEHSPFQAIADIIPADRIHLGKRLVSIDVGLFPEDEPDSSSEGVFLTFQDGSKHVADLVVGADGVHSVHPPFPSSSTVQTKTHRSQMALRAVFDEVYIQDLIVGNPELRNSVHVVGPDRNFFSSMLGKGKFTVVGLGYYPVEEEEEEEERNSAWKGKKWDDVVDVESFRKEYKDWNPWITDLLDRIPSNSLRVHPGWASNQVPPPVYAGRIVLLGDAFHPHGGAFAAGGSLAIDDSIALFLSLQHVQQQSSTPSTSSSSDASSDSRSKVSARRRLSTSKLSHALDLYASTRLPHTGRVFSVVERMRDSVAKPGRVWDEEKIQEWARDKKEVVWLHEHDVHRAFVDALNSEHTS
ncbi:MAG: FAD/NAD-P-binding domain-containing protein [Lentinula lateritia]|nr:MAG: FAD/NAD-P-binding domain-containing protein [Lentinula lateritia]